MDSGPGSACVIERVEETFNAPFSIGAVEFGKAQIVTDEQTAAYAMDVERGKVIAG